MEIEYEKKYHEVERDNWWFVSRRKFLLDALKNVPKDSIILDIGCSSGIFLKELASIGFKMEQLYGIDISEKAIENCKNNGLQNVFVMDAQNITLTEKFDIIVASDCLEHLQDDTKAIKNWCDLLQIGGVIYVFVPAFQSLWSSHDEVNMHFRRYTSTELKVILQKEKLTILKSSYWNFFLFIPLYIFRKIDAVLSGNKKKEGHIIDGAMTNIILLKLLLLENWLLKFVNFPFGVSTFCIAKKK
ncbi:class I SAM-dependent methyltransferase [Flavobacterium cellulosilyticum]|uniref:Class I SAM-dependent methyltransferase n=1 Tax=Flavobacterium cellulosilyticum TaxID=2541731 RepID=A0A4R5CI71_9FLAO|nr:class I SAM-dependent methyltransferase [Flavobacterium cellulosilyticum]TDD98796.1 class I SAM-dependent methyltransferase [Flavobacterium cellulosilyticum]